MPAKLAASQHLGSASPSISSISLYYTTNVCKSPKKNNKRDCLKNEGAGEREIESASWGERERGRDGAIESRILERASQGLYMMSWCACGSMESAGS